jgi:hypothetical protein
MTRIVCHVGFCTVAVALLGCTTKEAKTPPPTGTAVSVKAGELLTEYGANAVAADGKYKGKLLRVTGKFGSAQKAPLMGYAVQVLPEDAGDVNLSGVECFMLDSAVAEVGKFQPGQMISIQGVCDGQVLGQVKMSKCTVVP